MDEMRGSKESSHAFSLFALSVKRLEMIAELEALRDER
jgi:hypothetical protein